MNSLKFFTFILIIHLPDIIYADELDQLQGEYNNINLDDIDVAQAYFQEQGSINKDRIINDKSKLQDSANDYIDPLNIKTSNNDYSEIPVMGREDDLKDHDIYAGMNGHPGINGLGGMGGHPGLNQFNGMGGHLGMNGYGGMGGHPGMNGFGGMGGHEGGQDFGRIRQNSRSNNIYNSESINRGINGNINNYNQNQNQEIQNSSGIGYYLSYLSSSFYEILVFFFLSGFIFNCVFGKTHNDKFASAWYNANKQYFEERYDKLGVTDDLENDVAKKNKTPLIKETPQIYKYYAAGYRYIKWILIVLEFRKRHDALFILTFMITDNRDRMVYEVSINPSEEVSWVFCICKKRDAKYIKKQYQDIDFFCKQYEPSIMNERLCLLSENNQLFCDIFQNKTLLNYYKEIEEFIDVVYYTDQNSFCTEKYAIYFSFDIHLNKTSGHERKLLEITHFVNLFCDSLAQIKYSPQMKSELSKNRVLFERNKMEEEKRKEIEKKERDDFIEQWKMRNKMKGKKPKKIKKDEKAK